MSQNQQIAKALAAATDTAALEIGIDILDRVPAMFKEQFPEKRALIVADETKTLKSSRFFNISFSKPSIKSIFKLRS